MFPEMHFHNVYSRRDLRFMYALGMMQVLFLEAEGKKNYLV
jgi:hypothetical protein